jgi:hypothetical protein
MKRSTRWMVLAFVVGGGVLLGGAVYTFARLFQLDAEAKDYAVRVMPAILNGWNAKELLDRASPELIAAVKQDQWDSMFALFREKLGQFESIELTEGHANVSLTTGSGKLTTATCTLAGQFSKGPANIDISLVKRGEAWQFLSFYVRSDLLMPGAAPPTTRPVSTNGTAP